MRSRTTEAIRQRLGQSEEAAKAYRRAIVLFEEFSPRSAANGNFVLNWSYSQLEKALRQVDEEPQPPEKEPKADQERNSPRPSP